MAHSREFYVFQRKKYDKYCRRAIKRICALPDECMQLANEDLKNVWEEIVVQVRFGESLVWNLYEDYLEGVCLQVLENLPREEIGILWLGSDGWCNWDEAEPLPCDGDMRDQVAAEMKKRLLNIADAWELHPKVERYFYRGD